MAAGVGASLLFFHNRVMFIVIFITILVFWIIKKTFSTSKFDSTLDHGARLEVGWTIVPMLILIFLAIPSLRILYAMEESPRPAVSLKAIGRQWYWRYEIGQKSFESYLIPTNDLNIGSPRLLAADAFVALPLGSDSRILSLGGDVIHSFAVPSLAIKSDAIPGRLNQSALNPLRAGTFFGQCSEICGADHSFMPINIKIMSMTSYLNWYNSLD